MPDQWGRPTYGDFMHLAHGWSEAQRRGYEVQQQKKTDEYGKRILSGEQIDPSKEKDFNMQAYVNAAVDNLHLIKANDEVKKAKIEQDQAELDDHITWAQHKLSNGDIPGFYQHVAQSYKKFPDGRNIVDFDFDNKIMKVEVSPGQIEDQPLIEPDQALQLMQGFSKDYRKIASEQYAKREKLNAELLKKPIVVVADDGTAGLQYTAMGRDGRIIQTIYDQNTGQVIGGVDPNTGQVIEPKSPFKPLQVKDQESKIKERDLRAKQIEANTNLAKARTGVAQAQRTKIATGGGKGDTDAAKKDIDRMKAELSIVLQPFAGSKQTFDPNTGEVTQDGKTALDAVHVLVTKYRNKEPLTDSEKGKLKHAIRAWDMYGKMSDQVSGRWQGEKNASWRDWQ